MPALAVGAVALILATAAPRLLVALVALALVAGLALVLAGRSVSWRQLAARVVLGRAGAEPHAAVRAQLDRAHADVRRTLAEHAATLAQLDQARRERDQAVTARRAALDQADAAEARVRELGGQLAGADLRHAREVAELSRQLGEARESAQLAWDAAASEAPRCRFCRRELDTDGECPAACDDYPPDRRAALLADPLSGAHPLGNG